MNLTIHRGAKQIGGCVTEIETEKTKVFIDLGADLDKDKEKAVSKVEINGLTKGSAENSYLLLTHYHGDHIGRITQALPEVEIYMGKTAKEIHIALLKKLAKTTEWEIFKKIKTFSPGEPFFLGDIKITPLMIDHSAFDAYSFVIENNGIRVLYTGDFRLHGPRGRIDVFKYHAKNINCMVCEGTNVLKSSIAKTEFELGQEAKELFKKYKYVFILCSTTNIDRIFTFYNAYNNVFKGKRPFICDKYQNEILKTVSEKHGEISRFYNYEKNETNARNGYCGLIRSNKMFKEMLEKHFAKHPSDDESLIIYSMWDGYLDEKNEKANSEDLINFLKPYSSKCKHLLTSGHADVKDLKKVEEIIKPKYVIPIHTDYPERFKDIFTNAKILADGQAVELRAEDIAVPIEKQ